MPRFEISWHLHPDAANDEAPPSGLCFIEGRSHDDAVSRFIREAVEDYRKIGLALEPSQIIITSAKPKD